MKINLHPKFYDMKGSIQQKNKTVSLIMFYRELCHKESIEILELILSNIDSSNIQQSRELIKLLVCDGYY
jgi:hypothetical protein